VAHGIRPRPEPPKKRKYTDAAYEKAKERYAKRVETWEKDKKTFLEMRRTLNLSHDDAQNLLVKHFWQPGETGESGSDKTGNSTKEAYSSRGKALAKLYGKDYQKWRDDFIKKPVVDGVEQPSEREKKLAEWQKKISAK
jgi:hypothetical protein